MKRFSSFISVFFLSPFHFNCAGAIRATRTASMCRRASGVSACASLTLSASWVSLRRVGLSVEKRDMMPVPLQLLALPKSSNEPEHDMLAHDDWRRGDRYEKLSTKHHHHHHHHKRTWLTWHKTKLATRPRKIQARSQEEARGHRPWDYVRPPPWAEFTWKKLFVLTLVFPFYPRIYYDMLWLIVTEEL